MKTVKVSAIIFLLVVSGRILYIRGNNSEIYEYMEFLLNSLPNFISMLILSIFVALTSPLEKRVEYTHGVFFGLLIYEFMQIWLPGSTFDYFDLLFTFLGWVIVMIFYKLNAAWPVWRLP